MISKAEYKAMRFLIRRGPDALQIDNYKNGQHRNALKALRAKGFIMLGVPSKNHPEQNPNYKITSAGYSAYFLYKDEKQWFTPRYVLENIAVPISIAVITTLITLLISA